MTKTQLIFMIDNVLEKYQFCRNGSLWKREYCDFVDVIDLQISKSKDMFTINAGVADKLITRACWGISSSCMVEEPICTVRARLGELLYGKDVWWKISDASDIEKVLSGIQDGAVPFLQFNHSIDRMIETLLKDPASRRYPPGVIYLALLHHRKGDGRRCREMFESMKLTVPWRQKASDILDALN